MNPFSSQPSAHPPTVGTISSMSRDRPYISEAGKVSRVTSSREAVAHVFAATVDTLHGSKSNPGALPYENPFLTREEGVSINPAAAHHGGRPLGHSGQHPNKSGPLHGSMSSSGRSPSSCIATVQLIDPPQPTLELLPELPRLWTSRPEELESLDICRAAWALVTAAVGGSADQSLVEAMRVQLKLSRQEALAWRQGLKVITGMQATTQPGALDLFARMATQVEPQQLGENVPFQDFVSMRRSNASMVLEAVKASQASGAPDQEGRRRRARLRAALRRIDVGCEDDYDTEEYREGGAAVPELCFQITGGKLHPTFGALVCLTLMNGMFDKNDLATYIDDHASLTRVCMGTIWPQLGVSSLMHSSAAAWAHLRAFFKTREKRLLRHLLPHLASMTPAARGSEEDPRATELANAVLQEAMEYMKEQGRDYYAAFRQDADNLGALLEVLVAVAAGQGMEADALAAEVAALVQSSVEVEYTRRRVAAQRFTDPGPPELISAMDVASAMVLEVTWTSAFTHTALPAAQAVVAATLIPLVETRLEAYLSTASTPDREFAQVIRAAERLSHVLTSALATAGPPEGLSPAVTAHLTAHSVWDVSGIVRKVLSAWTDAQVTEMSAFVRRSLGVERWRGDTSHDGASSSAVDLAVLVHNAFAALFDLRLPLREACVADFVTGIESVMQRYTEHILVLLGTLERVTPPLPRPTRFKKDQVKKQLDAEASKGAMGMVRSVPQIQSSPEYVNVHQSLPTPVLICMMASLRHVARELETAVLVAAERWGEGGAAAATAAASPASAAASGAAAVRGVGGGANLREVVSEMMQPAERVVETALQYTCRFLATKVVFWDMRHQWCERLYRHQVAAGGPAPVDLSCRMEVVVQELERVMTADWAAMPADLRVLCATWLCNCSVEALVRAWTDGGPCRWYQPDDVPSLRADLERLMKLFEAHIDTALRTTLQGNLHRAEMVLAAMALPTGTLVSMLNSAAGRVDKRSTPNAPTSAAVAVNGVQVELTEEDVLRVLARRPDRAGSKVLKKLYEMPKKLDI